MKLRGSSLDAGAFIVSEPPGIDCKVASEAATCEAAMPRGPVTLSFKVGTPPGPASLAQFSVTREGKREICGGQMATTACTLQLDSDAEVEVSMINVPPPPPP